MKKCLNLFFILVFTLAGCKSSENKVESAGEPEKKRNSIVIKKCH